MVRLSEFVTAHVLIHGIVVPNVYNVRIRICGIFAVPEIELHEKLAACVLDEVNI